MPRLAWLTDLHFDFATEEQIIRLVAEIRDSNPSAVLIGGDLGVADSWENALHRLDEQLEVPLYFVLGNHDYYHSSIEAVRERAGQVTREFERLYWLPACHVVSLDSRTALVGHGGWGDARAADFSRSLVLLNDYFLIRELQNPSGLKRPVQTGWGDPSAVLNPDLESRLRELGDETARHFLEVLPAALAKHDHVIALMHVPPFREACWHEGRISDDNWAPHFCCIAAGKALLSVMKQHPQKRLTVLCGHTHGGGRADLLPNLTVHTGEAEYGRPAIQCIIDTAELD